MLELIPSLSPTPNPVVPLPPEPVLELASGTGPGETPSTPRADLLLRVRGGFRMAIMSSSAAPSAAAATIASLIMESAKLMRALTLVCPTAPLAYSRMGKLIGIAKTFQFEGGPRRLGRRIQDQPSAIDANSLQPCAATPEWMLAARASAAELLVTARSMDALRTLQPAHRLPPPCRMLHSGYIILTKALDRRRQQGSVGMSKPWDAPLDSTDLAAYAMRETTVPPYLLWTLYAVVRDPYTAQERTWQRRRCTQLVGRLICLGREVLETSTVVSAELQRQVKTVKFTLGCMWG